MKNVVIQSCMLAVMLLFASCNSQQDTGEQAAADYPEEFQTKALTEEDAGFLINVYTLNMMLSEAGQLALEKTNNPQVKEFAKTSLEDHQAARQKMQALAEQMGVSMPERLPEARQSQLDALKSADASAFDQQYVKMIDASSDHIVGELEGAASRAENMQLSEYAKDIKETFREHKQKVDILESAI